MRLILLALLFGSEKCMEPRRATLWSALNHYEIAEVQLSIEKELAWVNALYIGQMFNQGTISRATHEQLQNKLQITRNLFEQIDTQMAKEDTQQKFLEKILNAWMPELKMVPAGATLQLAFQISSYLYRRSKRLQEPVKQLIAQKKLDFAQVEKDFAHLQVTEDADFQERKNI